MKLNLDVLKDEILEQLAAEGFAVFHGYCRHGESRPVAYWDTARAPDFRPFLATARQAGARTVVFRQVEFVAEMVEDAIDSLEDCELPSEERRGLERRLREMQAYQGFTCALELSYDSEGRTYVWELRAEWYSEFLRILDEIDSYLPEDDERGEEDSMGGYFSRN
jgi:hypothetical protein